MKICIITNGYPLNSEDYWGAFGYSFARVLKDIGHDVYVFTPDRKEEKQKDEEVEIFWFPWLGGRKPLVKLRFYNPIDVAGIISLMYSGRKNILKFVEKHSIDICLAMWAAPSGIFAEHAKKRLGIPYAVWCLGSDIWIYSKYPIISGIMKRALRNSNAIFADGLKLCEDTKAFCRSDCHFMATSRTLPAPSEETGLTNPEKHNFFFVGRIENVKGVDVLIGAMKILIHEYVKKDARLYLFGVGSKERDIQSMIRAYGLDEYIYCKGYASAQDVSGYLRACRWAVIPSRNESIPVALSDALQMGRPLIVTDVGDMGSLVRKYDIGYVVKSEDARGLSEAMKKAMEDTNYERKSMNTQKAYEQFDLKRNAEKFLRYAEKITKQKT